MAAPSVYWGMLRAELNRHRQIGVEYEMTLPLVGTGNGTDIQRTLAEVLTSNGLPAIHRGYCHNGLPEGVDLAVEYDSSVQGENRYSGIRWYPVELKTRILNGYDDWERIVPKALEICRYMGARVNASCGHHVHLSFGEIRSDFTSIRSLYNLVHRVEPVIYGLVAPSRRTSGYCRPIPHGPKLLHHCNSLSSVREALQHWDRRIGFNLDHVLESSPHIEFRWHHGTLDAAKARHWLRFLLQMTEHAINRNCQAFPDQLPNDRTGIERAMISLGFKVNSRIYSAVHPELRETGAYLLSRWKLLNGRQSLARAKAVEKAAAPAWEEECEAVA